MYFAHGGYSEYPVVGVSWEQANGSPTAYHPPAVLLAVKAYGGTISSSYRSRMGVCRQAGVNENMYPWEGDPASERGQRLFLAPISSRGPPKVIGVRDGHVMYPAPAHTRPTISAFTTWPAM